jgi:adenylate cyclase class IV
MIEIEKKFQPTEEQMKSLLVDAELVKTKDIVDIYYDTPTFEYFKKDIKLRLRNGEYELKIIIKNSTKSGAKQAIEITEPKEILANLGFDTSLDLDRVVKEKLEVLVDLRTHRTEYKKEGFTIDVDETNFGNKSCEIELVFEDESESVEAEQKIIDFAKKFGLEMTNPPTKIGEYLRIYRPEVYKELFLK